MRITPRHMCGMLILLCIAPATAQDRKAERSEAPPARTEYKGRPIARTMHYAGAPWLVRESRQKEENTQKLMEVLAIERGDVACDLGSGNGYYTLKMARAVGEEGRVLAVDIQEEMLDMLMARARRAGVEDRIEPILGQLHDPDLPDSVLDLVLLVDAYHEFSHPVHMLDHIRRSLKPTGRVALVEYRLEDPDVPIKPLHKMSKKQIMKELPPNGFRLVEEFDELPWQHVMFFERDDIIGDAKAELVAEGATLQPVKSAAKGDDRDTAEDEKGNTYRKAEEKVVVDSPAGKRLLEIHAPAPVVRVFFDEQRSNTLFIDTGETLYGLKMRVDGRRNAQD